jgi:hypothetical protein
MIAHGYPRTALLANAGGLRELALEERLLPCLLRVSFGTYAQDTPLFHRGDGNGIGPERNTF